MRLKGTWTRTRWRRTSWSVSKSLDAKPRPAGPRTFRTTKWSKGSVWTQVYGPVKKNFRWTCLFGEIRLVERIGRSESSSYVRPLTQRLKLSHRGRSRRVQRALTWLGSQKSFGEAAAGFKELFGHEIPTTTLRSDTIAHAKAIQARHKAQEQKPFRALPVDGPDALVARRTDA